MNTQIFELADKLWRIHPKEIDDMGFKTRKEFYEHELRKFAELIVRECMDKIETYPIPVGNSPAGEMAFAWTYDALEQIREDIKEHFGVE